MQIFRSFLDAASFMDLEIGGSKYTWSNNREEALAIPPISSDHTPIILNINPEGHSQQDFKFEAYWQDHDQCQNIIQESWKPNAQEESHWTIRTCEFKSKGNYSHFLVANFTSILWAIWKGRDHMDQTWKQQVSRSWRPPHADAIMINCDAAFKAQSQLAAIAAIARDSSGVILSLSSEIVHASSPLLTEALVVQEAVLLASGIFWPRILVESDNQKVIEALRGGNQFWVIEQVVRDIQISSSFLPFCGFLWTRREGNNLAQSLAHLTMQSASSFHSISSLPVCIWEIANSERRSILSHTMPTSIFSFAAAQAENASLNPGADNLAGDHHL
ncbi:Ribonuclease H-like superfamily [Sesbania bispinosa]|nr:Ribonuclease H-like superfamily [Sesbania bispinosa]